MKKNHKLWLAIVAVSVLFLAACGSGSSSESSGGTDTQTEDTTDESTDTSDDASDTEETEEDMSEEEMSDEEMSEEDSGDMAEDEAGDEESGDAEAASGDVISEECPIPNPESEIEINAMGWEFPIVTEYGEQLRDCEEGNYSFNLQYLDSNEARDAMTADAATGNPSYQLYQGSNSFIMELAQQDFLMPLNDLVDKYRDEFELDSIDQAFWDMNTLDGNIYSLPMVSNTMHLFYNKPLLEEAGASVPTTYDEAFETCEAVKAAGNDVGFIFMLSAGWSWQIEFDSVLGAMGELPIDPDTGAPNFNTEKGIEAANLLKRFNDECGGSAASSYSTDDIQAGFQTGELVIGHTWASRAAAMDDPEASTVVGEIEFAPALSAGGAVLGAPAYSDGWGIPTGTPPEMVEPIFLAMLAATDAESQDAAAAFGTVTRTGATNPDGPRDGDAVQTSLVDGRGADLVHPAAGIARAKLGDALVTILDGTSVEDALAEAESAYLEEANAQGLLSE